MKCIVNHFAKDTLVDNINTNHAWVIQTICKLVGRHVMLQIMAITMLILELLKLENNFAFIMDSKMETV